MSNALREALSIANWIPLIEFGGVLIIVGYVLAALWTLLRQRDNQGMQRAQLLVAEGALWGLSFNVAGSLLKTILLHTWEQILFFAIILALRTLLKRIFTWEQRLIHQREARG